MDHTIVHRAAALLDLRSKLQTIIPALSADPSGATATVTIQAAPTVTEAGSQDGARITFSLTADAMQGFYDWLVSAKAGAEALLTSAGVTYPE